jgi:hypothetical protein
MTDQEEFFDHRRRERTLLREQIALMEAHKAGRGGFGTTSGTRDTTQESINTTKAALAELEAVIAKHERSVEAKRP